MSLWTPEEKQIVVPELIKGRSMVGYSRRGFLGMIAAAAAGAGLLEPEGVSIREIAKWHESLTIFYRYGDPKLELSYRKGTMKPLDWSRFPGEPCWIPNGSIIG